ncbi:hypothetical protein RRG08_040905 [Elysia crispata]|uniref:Uncharacterized protein n=1 Tax=Elysia crispata TaxID=231223 RepID=A0AAE1DL01_9GAST|nr:hypothetical protein RRG08_040905 [Elysia crispata]
MEILKPACLNRFSNLIVVGILSDITPRDLLVLFCGRESCSAGRKGDIHRSLTPGHNWCLPELVLTSQPIIKGYSRFLSSALSAVWFRNRRTLIETNSAQFFNFRTSPHILSTAFRVFYGSVRCWVLA